jgi:hypothetical protein
VDFVALIAAIASIFSGPVADATGTGTLHINNSG